MIEHLQRLDRYSFAVQFCSTTTCWWRLTLAALVFPLTFGAAAQAAPAPRLDFTSDQFAFAESVAGSPGLASFYGANGLAPVFLGLEAAPQRQALIDAIASAPEHGLPRARYRPAELAHIHERGPSTLADEVTFARSLEAWVHDVSGGLVDPRKVDSANHRTVKRADVGAVLTELAAAADPAAVLRGIEQRDPRYLALQAALAELGMLSAPASAPKVPAGLYKPGASGPGVAALRQRLSAIGFSVQGDEEYDEALAQAVQEFQRRAGLNPDGIAGPRTLERLNEGVGPRARALVMALERMRWLNGHDPQARQVWVNLPEYTAEIRDGGRSVFETRVVIGKTDAHMETPEFSDMMEHIVVNPRWNVPRSMTVRDYLPRLQANRYAVAHLDVVDGRGRVMPRDQIDFSRYTAANFPFRLQQQPGDDNALGEVKFIFPNRWNIYLHDTPSRGLFAERRRAFSNGCIRIQRPVELAHALLEGQVNDPGATYARARNSGREAWLALDPDIPVHLVYFTTLPDDDGTIRSYPDIYNRDGKLWQALLKAGLENDREEG